MHLLYLDDSGSVKNVSEGYLVLAGISVSESQAPWITQELDVLADRHTSDSPNLLEFHASEICQGRTAPWRSIRNRADRQQVALDVLAVLDRSYDTAVAFACAVHKPSFPGEDAMELAFEDLCSRFSMYLSNLPKDSQPRERGLIILDKSSYETSLQRLALDFRTLGTRWKGGVIQNLVETPLFVDSKASRCIQMADHIAYAVFRRYQHGDTLLFDQVAGRFHQQDGIPHGLAHKQKYIKSCMCPACLSRRLGPNT